MAIAPSAEFLQLQPVVAGRYSLERELGRGGMGVVFLARDVALDRPVAVKLLPPALAIEPEARGRFLREARTAAKLSHPNVVPIHLVEEQGDVVFFVMMFVDGETLGQRVRRAGPLTASQATRMMQEVAWALAYAHGRGVVHRDIKPENILLDKDTGRAMVTDFGIARVAEQGTFSGAGELVGTAHYMSPEQASGEPVDGRSDLFSLGITTFYALTGTLPFEAPGLPAVLFKIVNAPAPRLATVRPGVAESLSSAVDRCLSKLASSRFATGEELAEALATAPVTIEVPPQVRYFQKAVRDLDPSLALLTLSAFMLPQVWAALATTDTRLGMTIALVGPAVITSYTMIRALRTVIRAGLGPGDVTRAHARVVAAAIEEAEATWEPWLDSTYEIDRRRRRWKRLGHASAIALLPGFVFASVAEPFLRERIAGGVVVLFMVMVMGYIGAFVVGRQLKSKEQRPVLSIGLAERLLGTRMLGWLFRIAGAGLHVPKQNDSPASEKTEVLVAAASVQAFNRLSPALQEKFADVPIMIGKLEAAAILLRNRDEELGRAASDGIHHEGLEPARGRVRERLTTAVAALESIRLDLLRLATSVGTPDELTADLERARAIGVAVDAELASRMEVERMFAPSR